MEKNIKDYLHLYPNVLVDLESWFKNEILCERKCICVDFATSQSRIAFYYPNEINCRKSNDYWLPTKDIKPFLRPLSDINCEEALEFYRIANSEVDSSACCRKIIGLQFEVRWDNDVYRFDVDDLYSAEDVKFLLSKHFDLFGLIEAGVAIDKTKL